MKRTVKRIAPLQAGKMLGVLYACMGLIVLPIFMLAVAAGAFAQHAQGAQASSTAPAAVVAGIMFGMGLFMPVIYGGVHLRCYRRRHLQSCRRLDRRHRS
jgi:hypothetical protein